MSTQLSPASERVWSVIERERRRDKLVRRVSVTSWSVTGVAVLAYGGTTAVQVWQMVKLAMEGIAPWSEVYALTIPFVSVVGLLALLIAVLSTVGIFLRLRTASLSEIQMRLAGLEEMIASHLDLHDD
jgi:hypothetical protein